EDVLLSAQSDTEAFYGHLAKARDFTRRAADSAVRADSKESAAVWRVTAGLREAELGNSAEARHEVTTALALAPGRDVKVLSALALARAGESTQARSLLAELEKSDPNNTVFKLYWFPSVRAAIDLDSGSAQQALVDLEAAAPYELGTPQQFAVGTLYPVYLRGLAYLKLGKNAEAAAEFQKFSDHRGLVLNFPLGALARLQLARAYALSGDTAKAYATLAGLGAVAIAQSVGTIVGANLTVSTFLAVQPFLIQTAVAVAGSKTAALAAPAGSVGAISIGGPLTIIVLAVVIGVVQGVNVATTAELPGQLQSDLNAAQSYDPAGALRSSNADTSSKATQELYGAFLQMTTPDFPGAGALPAAQPTDPKLVIGGIPADAIQYLAWDKSRHTARLSGGWWVDTDAAGNARLTLGIDYLDPNGEGWTASRSGSQFKSTPASQPADAVSNVLIYQDWDGEAATATLA
ncbi:MAG: hypothetical protein JO023_17730, partial [Chloroflexi bacterium]|nr:hypothetical protein [Chloroflexota bacterium]